MKLKKTESIETRKIGGFVYVDTREFYKFMMPDGRLIETKAASEAEAKHNIERCLKVKLKEAA